PTPDAPNLTAFQTTTEKNTRDVAHTAEDVPKGGAEIAAILSKAAGLMERAIVSLRDTKLPEAYDPSQVKALAALEEAKAKAAEVMAQVAEKQEDANRETIRQVYEKVRAEQDAINKETTRIDANPRLPDGSYTRVDSVNLAKLPGQEGSLADKTKKLE